jgi:hypothetical protein
LARPVVYAEMDEEVWRRGETKMEGADVEEEKDVGVVGVEKVG